MVNSVNASGLSGAGLARNVRRLGHLDLAGAGQVTVAGRYAYVGHIPNRANLGTTILDVSDPANPRTVATGAPTNCRACAPSSPMRSGGRRPMRSWPRR
jgi:hypothetical protein